MTSNRWCESFHSSSSDGPQQSELLRREPLLEPGGRILTAVMVSVPHQRHAD